MTDYSKAAVEVAKQPAIIFAVMMGVLAAGMGFVSWLSSEQAMARYEKELEASLSVAEKLLAVMEQGAERDKRITVMMEEQHEQNAILRDRMGQCFEYLLEERRGAHDEVSGLVGFAGADCPGFGGCASER